jgi:2'-5' RNA ligase
MSHRLFVAVSLPREYRTLQEGLRRAHRSLDGIRWTRPEHLHLTVCFIGAVSDAELVSAIEGVREACRKASRFSLVFEQVRLGPSPSRPRMIWGVFRPHPSFDLLVGRIHAALEERNLPADLRRPPGAHVTLARFKGRVSLEPLRLTAGGELPPVEVARCELWESHLDREGPTYALVATCPFGGGGRGPGSA